MENLSCLAGAQKEDVWKIADNFRYWVCSELKNVSPAERLALRGEYLFIIDAKPCFIVLVDEVGAWSIALFYNNSSLSYILEADCPLNISLEDIQNCISYSARSTITTDSQTLQKLLLGKLKAKIAFLTGKVVLSGDLAAFLKMVSILKKRGIGPLTKDKAHALSDQPIS